MRIISAQCKEFCKRGKHSLWAQINKKPIPGEDQKGSGVWTDFWRIAYIVEGE